MALLEVLRVPLVCAYAVERRPTVRRRSSIQLATKAAAAAFVSVDYNLFESAFLVSSVGVALAPHPVLVCCGVSLATVASFGTTSDSKSASQSLQK